MMPKTTKRAAKVTVLISILRRYKIPNEINIVMGMVRAEMLATRIGCISKITRITVMMAMSISRRNILTE